jgi:hypothetical protein
MIGIYMRQSKQINRQKASSHPLTGGGTHVGIVRSFVNGRPTIFVPQLGCTYKDVEYLNNTQLGTLSPNDRVLCTFIDGQTKEVFVIGSFNKKTDVFVSVAKFNSLIDEIESRLGLPGNALDSFKQVT